MKGKIAFDSPNIAVHYSNTFKSWVLYTRGGFDFISKETAISLRKDYDDGRLWNLVKVSS